MRATKSFERIFLSVTQEQIIILCQCTCKFWSSVRQQSHQMEHPRAPHQMIPRRLGTLNCHLAHKWKLQSSHQGKLQTGVQLLSWRQSPKVRPYQVSIYLSTSSTSSGSFLNTGSMSQQPASIGRDKSTKAPAPDHQSIHNTLDSIVWLKSFHSISLNTIFFIYLKNTTFEAPTDCPLLASNCQQKNLYIWYRYNISKHRWIYQQSQIIIALFV